MTMLLSSTALASRFTCWELALLAVETSFHMHVHDELYTAIQHVDADKAWTRVTGFVMPPEVRAYSATFAPPKAGKAVARVFHAYTALKARSAYKQELLQRVRALASALPPDDVQQLGRAYSAHTFLDTWVQLHGAQTLDRAARAAAACLLHVLPRTFQLPAVVGDLTPEPVCWDDVPVITRVLTDAAMPVLSCGNQYAVLCHSAVQGSSTIQMLHASVGHTRSIAVDVDRAHHPVWLARAKQLFVVGCTDCVLRQVAPAATDVQWVVDVPDDGAALLPARNHLVKVKDYVIWQTAGTREVRGMRVDGMYVVEDSEEELGQLVSAKQRPVAARGSTVFSDARPLFQLPDTTQQTVVAVHSPTAEYVDVFTNVGDWWRVHVPTLTAHVVGLDLHSDRVIDVLCVY
jgi:hypothetical protein